MSKLEISTAGLPRRAAVGGGGGAVDGAGRHVAAQALPRRGHHRAHPGAAIKL